MKYIPEAQEMVTKNYKITGDKETIGKFERFLGLIQRNSAVGHSAICGIHIDGDGADRIKITPKPPMPKEEDIRVDKNGSVETV